MYVSSNAMVVLAVGVACSLSVGCSRAFWRQQADCDTYGILSEKTTDPRWDLPRLDVTPDPRSRFYDPYDPDCGPLPPDDPAAHKYMHWVAGKMGYKSWHTLGTAFSVENPNWLDNFGLTHNMTVAYEEDGNGSSLPAIDGLKLEEALELATIHNRDYQTQVEQAYLSALDLTFERFRYSIRYLGIDGRDATASLVHESIPDSDNDLTLGGKIGISRLLPTGAQLAVELANNTVWMFSGSNQSSTATTLSYSIVQPLLRGAGRKIVLEDLTQAERDVLYATRSLARFRKEFFTEIVAGRGTGGGYLGLLLLRQNILNQEGNIRRLEEQTEIQRVLASQKPEEIGEELEVFPAGAKIPPELVGKLRFDEVQRLLFWRGEMSEAHESLLLGMSDDAAFQLAAKELIQRLRAETITLTVAQLETELAASRIRLRTAERQFQDSMDSFKIDLGLPTDMPATLDLEMLKPFELIDPRLPVIELKIKEFVYDWAKLDDVDPDLEQLRELVGRLIALSVEVRTEGMQLVERDFARVESILAEDGQKPRESETGLARRRTFESEEERQRVFGDVQNDRRLYSSLTNDFHAAERGLQELQTRLSVDELPAEARIQAASRGADLREQLLKISQSLQVTQIGLRVELITVEPFSVSSEQAVRFGLENRLDLMNAKARVMDARRAVEVAANDLEAVLDVVAEGDLQTPAGNAPFDFRGSQSSFRAGVSFTAPLDLIAERNAYRAALVAYQRARRDYIEAEDNVKLAVREQWRQLEVTRQNFELNRQRVRIAALQYDNAVEEATAPVQQGSRGGSGALNLLQALNSVLAAQNNLINDWVDYERNRIQIHRDMGIMDVDANGIWTDEYYRQRAYGDEPDSGQDDGPGPAADQRQHEGTEIVLTAGVAADRHDAADSGLRGWRTRRVTDATGEGERQRRQEGHRVCDGHGDAEADAHHSDGTRRDREPD